MVDCERAYVGVLNAGSRLCIFFLDLDVDFSMSFSVL